MSLQLIGGALLFLGGLLAPSLKSLFEHVLLMPVLKREKDESTAESRADRAAEECFVELAALDRLIPQVAFQRNHRLVQSEEDLVERDKIVAEHDQALARLEANTALLQPAARDEMGVLIELLRYAHDLPEYRARIGGTFGWHPDSASTIASATVGYARQVLASEVRREAAPARPEQVQEYLIALDDREKDLLSEFAEEVHESDQRIRAWRTEHGLSPTRTAGPKE